MAKADVRNELLTATGVTATKGEDEIELASRVMQKIGEDDFDWNSLSSGAQAWFEKAAKADGDGEAIPALPGASAKAAPAPDKKVAPAKKASTAKKTTAKKKITAAKQAEPEPAVEAEKAAAKKAPAKKKTAKGAAATKGNGSAKEPRKSVTLMAIEMICKKPTITQEELAAKLAEKNVGMKYLYVPFGYAKTTIKVLQSLGKL